MRAAVSCKLLFYADDSALLTSGKDVSEIEGVLSRELESLIEWLEENRLSLHLGKTQSILFGSKKRLRTSNKLHVICNGSDIEPDVEVTYLVVNLDQSLSGSSIGSFHLKSPKKSANLNDSDPDFDESAYIWSL